MNRPAHPYAQPPGPALLRLKPPERMQLEDVLARIHLSGGGFIDVFDLGEWYPAGAASVIGIRASDGAWFSTNGPLLLVEGDVLTWSSGLILGGRSWVYS